VIIPAETEFAHRLGGVTPSLAHHPVDYCPANLAVVAKPELFLYVNANRPMPLFLVLRHRTTVCHEILTGWSQLVSATASKFHDWILRDDFVASHRALLAYARIP
jgi:hypothetical protein